MVFRRRGVLGGSGKSIPVLSAAGYRRGQMLRIPRTTIRLVSVPSSLPRMGRGGYPYTPSIAESVRLLPRRSRIPVGSSCLSST
eukprot:218252-Rhodomonas_salina.1